MKLFIEKKCFYNKKCTFFLCKIALLYAILIILGNYIAIYTMLSFRLPYMRGEISGKNQLDLSHTFEKTIFHSG